MQPRLDFRKVEPELLAAVLKLNTAVDRCGLEMGLLHLVKLRASQINGCSFCVDMHTREARADGESEQRLYLVSAWRESPLFSKRERIALTWTEKLTLIAGTEISDDLYQAALTEFSEEDIVRLTVAIGMINTWNRLCISFRAVHPVNTAAYTKDH